MALTRADQLNQGDRLDLKQIKQIIDLMKRSELSEFEFEEEGFKIKIKRGSGGLPIVSSIPQSAHPFPLETVGTPASAGKVASPAPAATQSGDEAGFAYVKSPMVGTFYRSPSHENPPFVRHGSNVEEKTAVW